MHPEQIQGPTETILTEQRPECQSTWYFITNHLNLMYMLAAGLIMPPKAFGPKYYKDTLDLLPGWIPFFAQNIPGDLLDMAVKESATLRPVIVAVNLSSLSGSALACSLMNGKVRDIRLPEGLVHIHAAIFVPAPLPTTFIESLCFASKEDKDAFEQDAVDYANVSLKRFKRSIQKKFFGRRSRGGWINREIVSETYNITMNPVLASGAMMAMLLNCGNMGDFSTHACRCAFDGISDENQPAPESALLQGLDHYMRSGIVPTAGKLSDVHYWGIIDRIAQQGVGMEAQHKNIVLDVLKQVKASTDIKYRDMIAGLAADLEGIAQFGDKNPSELFQAHPREARRALILFFLRSKCTELIGFEHPLLSERDYIAAALLFAAREKWIGLPLPLRDHPGLEQAVSHRMARKAHQTLETGLDLGPVPPRCVPLREMMLPGKSGWSKRQNMAALSLARDMGWHCINTRVRIGRGEYRVSVDAGGITIFSPGETRAVVTEIDQECFFNKMAQTKFIEKKAETKAYRHLSTSDDEP